MWGTGGSGWGWRRQVWSPIGRALSIERRSPRVALSLWLPRGMVPGVLGMFALKCRALCVVPSNCGRLPRGLLGVRVGARHVASPTQRAAPVRPGIRGEAKSRVLWAAWCRNCNCSCVVSNKLNHVANVINVDLPRLVGRRFAQKPEVSSV